MIECIIEQRALCELPTLDPGDLMDWLADFGGDDYWVDDGESVTQAGVAQGDRLIIWQDGPITDRTKSRLFPPDRFPGWKREYGTSRYGHPLPPGNMTAKEAREWGKRAVEVLADIELDGLSPQADTHYFMDAQRWADLVLDLVTKVIGLSDPVLLAYSSTLWADTEAAIEREMACGRVCQVEPDAAALECLDAIICEDKTYIRESLARRQYERSSELPGLSALTDARREDENQDCTRQREENPVIKNSTTILTTFSREGEERDE